MAQNKRRKKNDSMKHKEKKNSGEKPVLELPGTVEKVIHPINPNQAEKVQIAIEGADELYKEIRVENTGEDSWGGDGGLKAGAGSDLKGEGDMEAARPKKKKEPVEDSKVFGPR